MWFNLNLSTGRWHNWLCNAEWCKMCFGVIDETSCSQNGNDKLKNASMSHRQNRNEMIPNANNRIIYLLHLYLFLSSSRSTYKTKWFQRTQIINDNRNNNDKQWRYDTKRKWSGMWWGRTRIHRFESPNGDILTESSTFRGTSKWTIWLVFFRRVSCVWFDNKQIESNRVGHRLILVNSNSVAGCNMPFLYACAWTVEPDKCSCWFSMELLSFSILITFSNNFVFLRSWHSTTRKEWYSPTVV